MVQRKISAVIFDMDGTIISTIKAWDNILATFVGQENIQQFRLLRATAPGKGMDQTCYTLRTHFNIQQSNSEILQMFDLRAQEFFNAHDIDFIEGFEAFHESLKINNIKTILATNAPNYALNVLKKKLNLQELFGDAIYNSCMMDSVFKPDPKILLHAMKVNNIIPKECVVFEDTIKGITAAKSADIGFIVGVNSYDNKANLCDAHAIVDNFVNLTYESLTKL